MRALHHIARRCNDACLRLLSRRRAWLVIGSVIVAGSVIGAGLSIASIGPAAETTATPERSCAQQTWPRISPACLRTNRSAADAAPPRSVRQISLDRDAPRTVYIYPAAQKDSVAKAKRPAAADTRAKRRSERRSVSSRRAAAGRHR